MNPPWLAMVQAHADAAEARRKGRRRGKPIGRWAESRRVLDRAQALKFPTHRKGLT